MRKFRVPLALAVPALLGACGETPAYLLHPADPTIAVRPPRYTNVVSGVQRFGVVEPKDWRELNRAVGPKPGQNGMEGMPGMPGMGMGNGRRDTGGR